VHTAPYLSAFGVMAIILAARIIGFRMKFRVGINDGNNPELARAIRVFGNFTEWVPLGLILVIALEFIQAPIWYLHLTAGTLLLGRILHAIGLRSTAGPSPGRMIGMILTFTSYTLSSTGLLFFSIH
jgi:uncharacterized membrane protein YecN with MAPEG domain